MRAFTPEDAIPLHRILNEPNILQYFPHTDPPDMERVQALIKRQLAYWQEHNLGWWAVIPKGQVELVGWNGLQYLSKTGEVEVGYLLSRQFWGQGYATEGAKASLDFGFTVLNLDQIIGLTHPENTVSQHVLEKCGLIYVERKEYFGTELFRYTLQRKGT